VATRTHRKSLTAVTVVCQWGKVAAAQTIDQGGWRSGRGGAWNLGEPLGCNNWPGGWPERADTSVRCRGEEEGCDE
jgi:hypothetical protein